MDVFSLVMRLKEEGAAQVKASVDKLNRSFDEASGKAKVYDMTIGSLKDSLGGLASSLALAAVITKVVQETSDAAAATAQLNAVLKSTEGVARQSADQLNAHAQALSYMTAFDDDAITGAQALLLTFTKIQGDTFPKATEAVLDMATAMGTDLKSAAIQVGKALNDPILGVTALSRAGVQFNDQQKNMIELLVESNQLMTAQDVILAELRTQFEGSATAAANTLGGAIKQLNNELGNLATLSGENTTVVTKFVNATTDAVRGLDEVLADLGANIPTVEGRLGGLLGQIRDFVNTPSVFMLLAAMGRAKRNEALEAMAATGPAIQFPKTVRPFGVTGEGTAVPLSRTAQTDQLLRLAEVAKLTATQQAFLREEAARLTAEMNKQGVTIEKQIELGTKLKAIREALTVKTVKPLKLAEVTELGKAYLQTAGIPQIPIQVEAVPQVTLPPEVAAGTAGVFGSIEADFVNGWAEMMDRVSSQMANILVDSIAGAFENLTAVGGTIKSAFKVLTSGLLGGLGSMLIEFGRYVIVAGKLMTAVRESLKTMNPIAAVAAGVAMIAIGGMLRGAASRAFGGQGAAGGAATVPSMGMATGGSMGLPTQFYGPTAAGSASTIERINPVSVTIIGPNDPAAQRQMQELVRNAQRRGSV